MQFSAWLSLNNPWQELVEETEHADALGYHTVYIPDHFMPHGVNNLAPYMESWTCLAALATQTSNIRLSTFVTGNTYRNPGILAKQVAQVDIISNGRVTLGIGAGWAENEHVAYGIPFQTAPERLRRLNESVQILRSLFQNERTDFAGEFYDFRNAPLAPKPVQARLPIMVGGGGEKVTLRIVAEHADVWNCPPGSPEIFARKLGILNVHCERANRDPATIRKTGTMMVRFGEPPDGTPPFWDFVEDIQGLVETISRYADAGADELVIYFDPDRPLEARKETLSAFIQDVVPQFM